MLSGSVSDLVSIQSDSEVLEGEVPVRLQGAVVPVEHPLRLWYLEHPLDDQLRHLLKMTTAIDNYKVYDQSNGYWILVQWVTYLFPVGICLGLMSAALNAAKKSSHGAAS